MLDTVGAELQVVNKSEKAITLKADENVILTPNQGQEASSEILPINFAGLAKVQMHPPSLSLPRRFLCLEFSKGCCLPIVSSHNCGFIEKFNQLSLFMSYLDFNNQYHFLLLSSFRISIYFQKICHNIPLTLPHALSERKIDIFFVDIRRCISSFFTFSDNVAK